MLGSLPKSLDINGKRYEIRTDFRNVLRIFDAFLNDELTDKEKLFVCLKRMIVDFDHLPKHDYSKAYDQIAWFLNCGKVNRDSGNKPRTFSWIKDESLIFPAVNKVAGLEVREVPYMHWWTFMGFFESIDPDGLFGTVLSIRQKRARGKKLEKYEKDFYINNRDLMSLEISNEPIPQTTEERLLARFNQLAGEGD